VCAEGARVVRLRQGAYLQKLHNKRFPMVVLMNISKNTWFFGSSVGIWKVFPGTTKIEVSRPRRWGIEKISCRCRCRCRSMASFPQNFTTFAFKSDIFFVSFGQALSRVWLAPTLKWRVIFGPHSKSSKKQTSDKMSSQGFNYVF
jgi:hypothetical protein